MELVAASKMRRAVASTLSSRLYAEYSWEMITSVANNAEQITNPLFVQRDVKNILLVLITSNGSLCGGYNSQVIKRALGVLRGENGGANIDLVTIGKKGDGAMRRIGKNVIATFTDLPDSIILRDVVPISKFVVDEYKNGHYDKVLVAYTDFISALTQKPNVKQILPISKQDLKDLAEVMEEEAKETKVESKINYLFEGDQDTLIGSLAEKLSRMQIYQMLLESNASEQSARMVAMKNASEAAGEMIDDLTLVFNKARQASITQEISEISAGMASVS